MMYNMLMLKIKDISRWAFFFLAAAMFGWVFETIAVTAYDGRFALRGVLFVSHVDGLTVPWGFPAIAVYGFGGLIMYVIYKGWEKWKALKNPVVLFVVSAIVLTALELFASYLVEWIWGRTYWYYEGGPLNFQGRITLWSGLTWGALATFGAMVLFPWLEKVFEKYMKKEWQYWAIIMLVVYVLVCLLLRERLFPGVYSDDLLS